MKLPIKVKKLHPDAKIPTYGSKGASGADLYALELVAIEPGTTRQVKTGIAFELPKGFEIQVRPRSGLSLKTGLRVANAPGTVDSDYTGDCSVLLTNTGTEIYIVQPGDRIGQAVLCPVFQMELFESKELTETERGDKGFGSTGA